MASEIVRALNRDEINDLKNRAKEISDYGPHDIVTDNTLVFWVGFDGTYNTKDDPAFSHDTYSTAVGSLYDQIINASKGNNNVKAEYFPGPGTANTEIGSAINPTDQAQSDTEKAYKRIARKAYDWKKTHPDSEIKIMVASYSRGAAPAAMLSQMLYKDGLVYEHPETKADHYLAYPGEIGISAGLIISPVTTGVQGNLNFAPHSNVTIVQAKDEKRTFYTQNQYPGLQEYLVAGDHSDAGCTQDAGIGGILLPAYTGYFKNTGLPILNPSENRVHYEFTPVVVHKQTGGLAPETVANYFRNGPDSPIAAPVTGESFQTKCDTNNVCKTTYEDFKGNKVSITQKDGITESRTVTSDTRHTAPDGSVFWEMGTPKTDYYNYPSNYVPPDGFEDSEEDYISYGPGR